jgi:hypothetical protein
LLSDAEESLLPLFILKILRLGAEEGFLVTGKRLDFRQRSTRIWGGFVQLAGISKEDRNRNIFFTH